MSSNTFDVVKTSQLIRAGAGAGKTTRLIETFLDFVREFKKTNGRYPRVVMTTFTRKATQEVKERLLVSAFKQNEKEIFEFINQKSYVHISTIHGLLSLFLKQYAERIRFPQEMKIVDGPQYQRVLKRQINEILKKNLSYIELLESYSFNKLVAVAGQALELKAQNRNFSYLNESDLKECVSLQKKKITQSIDEIFAKSGTVQKGWVAYFDFLSQLRSAIENQSSAQIFQLVEEMPRKPAYKEDSPSIDPVAHELILELKDGPLKDLFDTDEFIAQQEKINKLFSEFLNDLYEVNFNHKRRTGELTMSDLESLTLQIIEQHPDCVEEFSESWDYFMIDEYQDTSPLQVRILNAIVRNKTCFIVGDPQQSIYLFRGARSEVFDIKQKEVQLAGARVDFLETNYRSEPSLMNFINLFFKELSKQFKPMKTKTSTASAKPQFYDAYYVKSEDQVLGALRHIQELLSAGAKPQDICVLSRNNRNLRQLALLAETNGVNVQLQSAAGFEETREVLDLVAFNKFLNNPHDDENFVNLARSPWFYISDDEIISLALQKKQNRESYWACINRASPIHREMFIKYLNLFDAAGILQATKQFLAEKNFLNMSAFYDLSGRREANIFKYLSALADAEKISGFSLGLFLEEQFQVLSVETGAGNSEAQPVVQPDCISLMTIHASKGLQFKHVVVMGFSDKVRLSINTELSFDPLSQKFSLSVFDDELNKHRPSQWAVHQRKLFNQRELNESERLLYVAMTRAIESLCIVSDSSKRGDKNAWVSQFTWPEVGEILNSNYRALSTEYNDILKSQFSIANEQFLVRKKFVESGESAESTQQSVTDMISVKSIDSEKIGPDIQLKNLKKAQHGSDLHRVFESLKYLDLESVRSKLSSEDKASVDYLFALKEIDLLEVLKRGHNEWGFGLKTKTRFIQGQIDLWAELDNEIHVLDYKTGSSFFSDKAFEQLSFYTKALSEMRQISDNKKIIHSVIYPVEKTILIKKFNNKSDFEAALAPKIKEIF